MKLGLPLAVAISILGMLVHTVAEFGLRGIVAFETAFIPWTLLQLGLLLAWARLPPARGAAGIALFLTSVVQLVGGAIVSVLPLAFLPFEPEQSLQHYAAHVVLGLAQLPLLVAPFRKEAR